MGQMYYLADLIEVYWPSRALWSSTSQFLAVFSCARFFCLL